MSKRIKELEKKNRLISYMWQIQNQLFSMFDYANLPFRKEFLEWELHRRGFVAIAKHDEKILVGSITWTEYDEYGLPLNGSTVDFYTRFGYQFSGVLGKDIIIGFNNPIRTPNLDIVYYAEMFNEIDTSIASNVIQSRVASVPMAKDDATKKAIESILDSIKLGETKTIASENILKDIVDGQTEPVKMLHLTQPEQIERVQYLSKLYDDLQRRFWNTYGHSMNSTGKMAQVSEMELEGYETYSMITPYSMLYSRKELIELCNDTFATNITIDFSKPWEHLKEKESEVVIDEEVIE